MTTSRQFDVIIIGGSYSGLAAAMALGRALKQVVVIDGGKPCNRQTPYSHNFLTQDGNTPAGIAGLAKQQLQRYDTVALFDGVASKGIKTEHDFEIEVETGELFKAKKLIFATGIRDVMPMIDGFADCFGISALHCPYCHGYEVRNDKTGILGNGDAGYELSMLISNWTKDLTLYTHGTSTLTAEQTTKLKKHHINIIETEVQKLEHRDGYVHDIILKDGSRAKVAAIYAHFAFEQHCTIPETLGCELTDDGYIKIDGFQETTVAGAYACGDNITRVRTVANAVAMGTTAGITVSKRMIYEAF